jgi:hypothetical protein
VSSARLLGSRTGSGRRIRLLKIEDNAVLAPMPSASVPMATTAKPGVLRSPRSAVRTSCHTLSTVANRPDVTRIFDGERNVAERALAGVCGVLCRKAVTLERVLTQRAVRLDLLPQIGIVARATKEVPRAAKDPGHRGAVLMPHTARGTRDEVVPNTC